jgi:hypothetical protein
MVDMLAQAASWLSGVRKANMTTVVTYTRPGTPPASVSVSATIGATTFQIENEYGMLVQFTSRDFLITASDLVLGSSVVQPKPGDTVSETAPSGTVVYQVLGPGKEPCWRWSDPYRNTIRVHTKQVQG